MTRLDARLRTTLSDLRARHNDRTLKPGLPGPDGTVRRGGRDLVNFSSNDYLGLSRHPTLIARARDWSERWGVGAGASRLVCGTLDLHAEVEDKLAAFKGTEAALVFNSGYQANSAILPALFDREMLGAEPLVFTDRLIHASMHHGCRSAGIREVRFRHNDMDHLESLLAAHAGREGVRFILTESVFSMDGDRADLAGLVDLAERHEAFLYVDEAHATGVLGPGGAGLSREFPGRVDLAMGTFSKALGGFGAYVAGSRRLMDYLVNRCAGFIYSTALPPAVLGAMDAALDLVPSLDAERGRVLAMAEQLRQALQKAGLDTGASTTQIVPAMVGGEAAALDASRALEEGGVLGIAIRPPTVPKGSSRIRFAVSAGHGPEQMARLLDLVPVIAATARAAR
ncbi:MAG: 8-amino-7-oxononanoate synthase [Alphaproteobacteria bacterium]